MTDNVMREISPSTQEVPLALGVDIGATAVKAAVVALDGELLQRFQQPSPRSLEGLQKFLHSALKDSPKTIRGIGIGCRGLIDAASTRINRIPGDLQFLQGKLLKEVVHTDSPVYADNDARTTLIGEVLWGVARGRRNAILLTLGTGVGGAVLADGVILHGFSNAAGHLGHISLDPAGGLCICGNRGCLETRFSSRAIESDYFAHLHRGAETRLPLDDNRNPPTVEAIYRAAAEGDPSAQCVISRATEYLASALVSFVNIFDPEVIILGGNVAAAGDQLFAPLRKEVAERTRPMLGRDVPIIQQSAIGFGGVAGAAALVFLQQQLLRI
jgi:glucokinase